MARDQHNGGQVRIPAKWSFAWPATHARRAGDGHSAYPRLLDTSAGGSVISGVHTRRTRSPNRWTMVWHRLADRSAFRPGMSWNGLVLPTCAQLTVKEGKRVQVHYVDKTRQTGGAAPTPLTSSPRNTSTGVMGCLSSPCPLVLAGSCTTLTGGLGNTGRQLRCQLFGRNTVKSTCTFPCALVA